MRPVGLEVAGQAGIGKLEVTYATRCYQTRHGAGPLPGEVAAPPVPRLADATNVPNDWQGTMRFARSTRTRWRPASGPILAMRAARGSKSCRSLRCRASTRRARRYLW